MCSRKLCSASFCVPENFVPQVFSKISVLKILKDWFRKISKYIIQNQDKIVNLII